MAAEIRRRYGRGLALVGQDNLRRHVLREHDVPGGANIDLIDLIDLTARFALQLALTLTLGQATGGLTACQRLSPLHLWCLRGASYVMPEV